MTSDFGFDLWDLLRRSCAVDRMRSRKLGDRSRSNCRQMAQVANRAAINGRRIVIVPGDLFCRREQHDEHRQKGEPTIRFGPIHHLFAE